MSLRLVVIEGKQQGKDILLREGRQMLVGRGEDCDLKLEGDGISRKHSYVCYEDNSLWIADAGSTNGTFVNTEKIKKKQHIAIADIIQIGSIRLSFSKPKKSAVHTGETTLLSSNVILRKNQEEPTFSLETVEHVRMKRDLVLLHKVGKLLQMERNVPDLLGTLMEDIVLSFTTDRGCAIIKSDEKNIAAYRTRFYEDESFSSHEFTPYALALHSAIGGEEGTVCSNIANNKKANASDSQICSAICVPIKGYDYIIGAIYLDSIFQNQDFDKQDLDLLTAIGRQVGMAVERSFIEKKLIDSEQHHRSINQSILEHSWNVIYRQKMDFSFLIISPSVQKLLGYPPEEVEDNAQTWRNCLHPEDKEEVLEKKSQVFEGKGCILKYRMIRKDGVEIWVEEMSHPIRDKKGNVICAQGIFKDITKNKALEDQLARAQKMEALGILAGGVAHDLNNILGALVGYPDLILMDLPKDSPCIEYVEGIKTSGELAADVVKDLLTMARRENYNMVPIDLNDVVNLYLGSLECDSAKSRCPNVEFKINLSPQPLIIHGSHSHIFKLIMNLVNNALQAIIKTGFVEISTDWAYLDKPVLGYDHILQGEYATLKIKDSGKGIADKDIKRIFEPFYSKKINSGGTGLGLAVVYGAIQDHKGYINVESAIGQGATFTIYMPLQRDKVQRNTTPIPKLQGQEKILVVDDIEEQRKLAKAFLKSLNYPVAAVSSGEEAIEYLSKSKVSLVVLDMIMEGGIDGLETYKRILEIRPGQKAIITSGFSNSKKVKEAQLLGASVYIQKPYTREKLAVAIRKELDSVAK